MRSPARKSVRLLSFVALAALTTGIAAAPVRNFLLPLASRPLHVFGSASHSVPTAPVPAIQPSTTIAKLDGDIGVGVIVELGTYSPVLARGDRREEVDDRGASTEESALRGSDSGISNRGAGQSRRAGSARLIGRQLGVAESDRNLQVGGVTQVGQRAAPDGAASGTLFAEHTAGLPGPDGKAKSGPVGAGPLQDAPNSVGPPVSANPEPSTLLLLGTGLVAGFSAVRRRLRST